eukprot:3537170-Karenia_brevis.AAC.1
MEESSGGILGDLPPSPESIPDVLGPPWPASTDSSFLVLPGKGNSSDVEAPGPSGPQDPINMVAERSRSDEEIAKNCQYGGS